MEREIGIPPDHQVHADRVYAHGTVPPKWDLVMLKIAEVHRRGVTGKGVKIAINDTGVTSHDHLPAPIAARDFTGSSSGTRDRNGHGTHCAGIALGRDGLGVAPDADLIVAKVLGDSGSGSTTGINNGRVWAADQGADVISESLGDGGGPDIPEDVRAYEKAYEAGALVCVAALGNAGFNGSRNTIGRPGSYRESIGIAAIKEDGRIANFSSGGKQADYATPGQNIISCNLNNGFVAMSGTSMATPFMAGLCALVIQWHRMQGLTPPKGFAEWRAYFQRFVKDEGTPGHDHSYGYGVPMILAVLDSLVPPGWV